MLPGGEPVPRVACGPRDQQPTLAVGRDHTGRSVVLVAPRPLESQHVLAELCAATGLRYGKPAQPDEIAVMSASPEWQNAYPVAPSPHDPNILHVSLLRPMQPRTLEFFADLTGLEFVADVVSL